MEITAYREIDNALTSARIILHNLSRFVPLEERREVAEKVSRLEKLRSKAQAQILKAIDERVKEPAAQILIKFYLQWYSTQEIADELNLSRRHVFRLKRQGVDAYNSAEKNVDFC